MTPFCFSSFFALNKLILLGLAATLVSDRSAFAFAPPITAMTPFSASFAPPLRGKVRVSSSNASSRSRPEEDRRDRRPVAVVPFSRFWRALYRGVTLPFPTLRQLTSAQQRPGRGGTKEDSNHTDQAHITSDFSLAEVGAAAFILLSLGVVSYHSTLWVCGGAAVSSSAAKPVSLIDALYFSIVTLTTVGYGDVVPTTAVGKVFTILFGLSGISILGLAISTLGARLAAAEQEWIVQTRVAASRRRWRMALRRRRQQKQQPDQSSSPDDKGTVADLPPHDDDTVVDTMPARRRLTFDSFPSWLQSLGSLLLKSAPSVALILWGGVLMGRMEGWPLLDSCYYAFITAVTLGYGDYAPTTRRGRLWAVAFIPLAVAGAGEILGNVATVWQERRHRQFYEALLQRPLNLEGLAKMDMDRSGKVSREEYVAFMLQEMKLVRKEDLDELHAQFEKLDVDGSGVLDQNDIVPEQEMGGEGTGQERNTD